MILKIFFLWGLANQSKLDSILIIASCKYIGVPHFCSDFLACLYHKYLSSNIEQLSDVLEGIEEQLENIKIIINKKLVLIIFICSIKIIDNY